MARTPWPPVESFSLTIKTVAPRRWSGTLVRLLLWAVIIAAGIGVWRLLNPPIETIKYRDLLPFLQQRQVEKWWIEKGTVVIATPTGKKRAVIPADQANTLWAALALSGGSMQEPPERWASLALIMPLVVMVGVFLWFWSSARRSSDASLPFSSRAKLLSGQTAKGRFQNIPGGPPPEIAEVIEYLREPQKFTKLGAKIPKALLLVGPPGSGKTHMAKAVAGEANVPFFFLNGPDCLDVIAGAAVSRMRDLFEQGKRNAPCFLFIDELDSVGRRRSVCPDPLSYEQELALSQLLAELDGFEANDGVILLAATNRPDLLDEALLRPGRFDTIIELTPLDSRKVEALLKTTTKTIPLAEDVDLVSLAKDITTALPVVRNDTVVKIANDAALGAAKYDKKKVQMVDFESALETAVQQQSLRGAPAPATV
jgi:cell division protease FtsH